MTETWSERDQASSRHGASQNGFRMLFYSFSSTADKITAITGRIKRGNDTIASIDDYWDSRIDIRDKKTFRAEFEIAAYAEQIRTPPQESLRVPYAKNANGTLC